MYDLSPICKLQLSDKRITLTEKGSVSFGHLMLLLVIIGGASVLIYVLLKPGSLVTAIFVSILLLLSLTVFYSALKNEYTEIDLINNSSVRTQRLGNIVIRKSEIIWPPGGCFKYKIYYDGEENLQAIWVIVYHPEKGNEKNLVRFFDKKTFHEFRKIFNNNFPENKIMESDSNQELK
jgi:hypothetical protein